MKPRDVAAIVGFFLIAYGYLDTGRVNGAVLLGAMLLIAAIYNATQNSPRHHARQAARDDEEVPS